MGKISEYILELTETFQDFLWHVGDWESAKRLMKENLSKDEYEFFEAHEDIIRMNIDDVIIGEDPKETDYQNKEEETQDYIPSEKEEDSFKNDRPDYKRFDETGKTDYMKRRKMDEKFTGGDSPQERFIDLKGPTGNVFSILAMASNLCKQLEEVNPEEYNWKRIKEEMQSSDYKNLVNTFEKYFGDYVTIYNADVLDESYKMPSINEF